VKYQRARSPPIVGTGPAPGQYPGDAFIAARESSARRWAVRKDARFLGGPDGSSSFGGLRGSRCPERNLAWVVNRGNMAGKRFRTSPLLRTVGALPPYVRRPPIWGQGSGGPARTFPGVAGVPTSSGFFTATVLFRAGNCIKPGDKRISADSWLGKSGVIVKADPRLEELGRLRRGGAGRSDEVDRRRLGAVQTSFARAGKNRRGFLPRPRGPAYEPLLRRTRPKKSRKPKNLGEISHGLRTTASEKDVPGGNLGTKGGIRHRT